MTKIKRKDEENEIITPDQTIDNKLELLRHITKVQSSIKDQINEDFTLCRLEAKDKEAVIEMTSNAYYGIRLLEAIRLNSTKWRWNNKKATWQQGYLTKTEKEIIDNHKKSIFQAFMTRVFMTAILNRNIKNNYLVKTIAETPNELDDKEELPEQIKPETMINRVKEKLKKALKKEEE